MEDLQRIEKVSLRLYPVSPDGYTYKRWSRYRIDDISSPLKSGEIEGLKGWLPLSIPSATPAQHRQRRPWLVGNTRGMGIEEVGLSRNWEDCAE